ncbi:MAG: GNAT family N-acetyltransferase [Cellvibrio sp.]|nr:GNAT family N-acetyltransferase [Cellvibrio sp.]
MGQDELIHKNVCILPLSNAPDIFSCVAQWHHQECERQGLKSTLELRRERLAKHIQSESIPKTFIATLNNELVGCVSLVNYAYGRDSVRAKITDTPLWLSNLFVQPAFRNRGIGNLLIEKAKAYAQELKLTELWLTATEFTDYYQKRNWEIARKTRLGGRLVNVMKIEL